MIRLDVGMSPATWGVWLGCLVPSIAVLHVPLLALSWMLFTSAEMPGLGLLMLLPVLALDALLAAVIVHHYTSAFWLDGRVLIRRTVTGRRYCDLSVAHVGAESAQPQWAGAAVQVLPRLVAQVPGHPPVRMWLRDPARKGALLPPHQLAALAQAIDPALAHPVARRLWDLASDPLGGAL